MKTIDEMIRELEKKYEMSFYGNERIVLHAFARELWLAATKAQLDNDDATWPRNELLPFPDDKPKEDK